MKINSVVLFFILLLIVFLSCCKDSAGKGGTTFLYTSYKDIPGLTQEEITAIEELKKMDRPLVFANPLSTEAFYNEEGEIDGFAILLCDWLCSFFDINFKAQIYTLGEVITKLDTGEIDFGALTATSERMKTYFMTSPIIHRSTKVMQLREKPSPQEIAPFRPVRYVFMEGTSLINTVSSVIPSGSFEALTARNHDAIYKMLVNGEADAYIGNNTVETEFDSYGNIITKDFLPLVITPVSLTARDAKFAPIISILSKALESGAYQHLTELYRQGYYSYKKNKFLTQLSKEEREYIQNTPIIPFAAQFMSYPVSFYNINEKKWEGIIFDIISEMEKLIGFKFQLFNDEKTDLPEIVKLLENGTVYTIPNLIQSDERRKIFIWPSTMYQSDRFAFLSKRSFPNIELNDIPFARVGFAKGSAFSDLFQSWFPTALYAKEFPSTDDAFMALERGEIDLVLSSQSRLSALTNYYEFSDYKANYIFNSSFDASFGFNKDQTVLCSIVDKALPHINTARIVEQWMSRTYNIEAMRLRKQRPLLFGFITLTLCVLTLIIILFQRSRLAGRRLEQLVIKRTHDLELQSTLLTTLFDSIPNFIFTMDTSLRFTHCNKAFVEHYGLSKEDIIYRGEDSTGISPEVMEEHSRLNRRVIKKRHTIVMEERIPRFDGETPIYETVRIPLILDGEVVGLLCVGHNITQRKEMEEAALIASRAKSEFLANMSHEIRTPMNSIIGFSELALDEETTPKTKEYLNKIKISAELLLEIINDILDISKIESGKMELEFIPFDINDLFTSCRTLVLPKAEEKKLEIFFFTEPCTGKMPLGDPTRLRQVLINLLSNAIKFTNIGTVKVTSKIIAKDERSVTILFEVKDTGIGMTPEQIERVFDPFTQAETGTTRQYGGTGLGLSITKNMLELMGGKLSVESTPGIGSTFSFLLMFDTINVDGNQSKSIIFNEIEKPVFEGEVLLCEDNIMNQQVISEHLAKVGLKTVVAENGKIGVELVKNRLIDGKKLFDLIFMDMHMPVMDGIEATIKILELKTGIPIVAMTANIMSSDREAYKKSGINDYLGKPFTSQELWKCLSRYFKTSEKNPSTPNEKPTSDILLENDMDFKKRLLKTFYKTNLTKLEELTNAIQAEDITLAHRLAHTLKGNAGQIRESALQHIAAEIENKLEGDKIFVTAQQLAILEKELNTVLSRLASDPEISSEAQFIPEKMLDSSAALDLLEKLEPLLNMGNPDSLKFIDKLRAIEGSELLIQQIEDFDFEAAVLTFNKLREKLKSG